MNSIGLNNTPPPHPKKQDPHKTYKLDTYVQPYLVARERWDRQVDENAASQLEAQGKERIFLQIVGNHSRRKELFFLNDFITDFNIIKAICIKPTADIILKGERLKESSSSKIRNKARIPTLTMSIQHCMEAGVRAVRQEKEIKAPNRKARMI